MPANTAEGCCSGVESTCIVIDRCTCKHASGDRTYGVFENPAYNDGISDGQGQRGDNRYQCQGFAEAFAFAGHFGGLTEGTHRACTHGTAEGHFTDDTGKADDDDTYEIRNQEGCTTQGRYSGREEPDVPHAHGRTDAGNDESSLTSETISFHFYYISL